MFSSRYYLLLATSLQELLIMVTEVPLYVEGPLFWSYKLHHVLEAERVEDTIDCWQLEGKLHSILKI